jgi:hypothetical protein
MKNKLNNAEILKKGPTLKTKNAKKETLKG